MSKNKEQKEKLEVSDAKLSIEKDILESNPHIFEGITPKEKERIISIVAMSAKSHRGPLPDSQTLKEYNEIIPNGADRIMTVFEKQSSHRMEVEKQVIGGQVKQSQLGQIFALIIGLFTISCATYCIVSGFEWSGALLGGGGLTSLVIAFIRGKNYQQKNLADKHPNKL